MTRLKNLAHRKGDRRRHHKRTGPHIDDFRTRTGDARLDMARSVWR